MPYVADLGFTHIEVMPIAEYPFDGSWGYQPISLFAPTSRYGTPDDFRFFVDACHRAGLGVWVDWVPGHFPNDAHGLARFDGTALYEHADPRQGLHRDWNTLIYNYGRREVANFLLSSALCWLREFHVDGIRVDAVASMLYLDYSRQPGEWIPNKYGGRENLDAIAFLQRMNEVLFGEKSGAHHGRRGVDRVADGVAPRLYRRARFRLQMEHGVDARHAELHDARPDPPQISPQRPDLWAALRLHENFVLPLSHDEVVHGKGSLIGKMPGDRWQKFANLRAYFAFMWTHPGKKLLFMGGEFAQEREWNHDIGLDWQLLDDPSHAGVQRLVRDLNRLYRSVPALHRRDCDPGGFEWIDANNGGESVLSYLRRGGDPDELAVVVCNFTPVPRSDYRIGVPRPGRYRERINTDAARLRRQRHRQCRRAWKPRVCRCTASPVRCAWVAAAGGRDLHLRGVTAVMARFGCGPARPIRSARPGTGAGVNFALFSAHAERVELCLFDRSGHRETARIALPEYTDEVWHGYLPEVRPGPALRLSRVRPLRPGERAPLQPTTSCCSILMPRRCMGRCAGTMCVFGYRVGGPREDLAFDRRDSARCMPKCRRGRDRVHLARGPPAAHAVGGIDHLETACPRLYDDASRGRSGATRQFPGAGKPGGDRLPAPSSASPRSSCCRCTPRCTSASSRRARLTNYWGYNTIGYFAPDPRFLPTGIIAEFKTMVQRLHDAGIEVLLDVVYNHTGEGNHLGPTLSFRGIDNPSYYRLTDDKRYYQDFTGTGNTLNLDHPRVLQMVMDSLRYWVEEMHVDGFRFDLCADARARGRRLRPGQRLLRRDPPGPGAGRGSS